MATTVPAETQAALDIAESIKPQLCGHPPEIQGAVLAQLLALWLAGHPRAVREPILTLHVMGARALVPVMEREIFAGGGHPNG